jgi:hypothetical protein
MAASSEASSQRRSRLRPVESHRERVAHRVYPEAAPHRCRRKTHPLRGEAADRLHHLEAACRPREVYPAGSPRRTHQSAAGTVDHRRVARPEHPRAAVPRGRSASHHRRRTTSRPHRERHHPEQEPHPQAESRHQAQAQRPRTDHLCHPVQAHHPARVHRPEHLGRRPQAAHPEAAGGNLEGHRRARPAEYRPRPECRDHPEYPLAGRREHRPEHPAYLDRRVQRTQAAHHPGPRPGHPLAADHQPAKHRRSSRQCSGLNPGRAGRQPEAHRVRRHREPERHRRRRTLERHHSGLAPPEAVHRADPAGRGHRADRPEPARGAASRE